MSKRGTIAWNTLSLEILVQSLFKECPEETTVQWNVLWGMLNKKINPFLSNCGTDRLNVLILLKVFRVVQMLYKPKGYFILFFISSSAGLKNLPSGADCWLPLDNDGSNQDFLVPE